MAREPDGRFVERARTIRRESRYIDFKEQFDVADDGEWLELLKDFVALANSGGGAIMVGLRNNGQPSGEDVSAVLGLDAATIGDKVHRYTNEHFSAFEVTEIRRDGKRLAVIEVGAAESAPLAFTRVGTYHIGNGKQRTAFSKGTVYFRHGAKSEPGTAGDFQDFIERRLDQVRDSWLGGIQQVVAAPAGAQVAVVQTTARDAHGQPTEIRLTDDPRAPTFGMLDPDKTHPYRQTELIKEVTRGLPGKASINSHDVLSVRRAHGIGPDTHPQFMHELRWGGAPQYSPAFVDWLLGRYRRDKGFFQKARDQYYDQTHPADS